MQAIILAGGLGTRLRSVVPDLPKPLAPIGDRPFLYFVINHIKKYGVQDIIISTGYRSKDIMDVCKDGSEFGVKIEYANEDLPLGTGGAIRHALPYVKDEIVLVLNGDTFFDIDIRTLERYHRKWNSRVTIALKYPSTRNRYGLVQIDQKYQVTAFRERQGPEEIEGYINGGIYLINRDMIKDIPQGNCSLEKDLLPNWVGEGIIYGLPFGGRFIDIGIPEDYWIASEQLPKWVNQAKSRALFLDRDGVINEDFGYVWRKEDVVLIPRILELIRRANHLGWKVVVVTNQAGVARGYYREEDVQALHRWMHRELMRSGVHVDAYYYCPHHPEGTVKEYQTCCLCRKPFPGMILRASEELNICLQRSRMIGDKKTDLIHIPYLKSNILSMRCKDVSLFETNI